jgi:hypothetical protein
MMEVKSEKEKGKRDKREEGKMFSRTLLGFGILILGFVLAGCGGTTSSSYFYGNPGWTVDGKIICLKELESTTKDVFGSETGSSVSFGVVGMSAAGTSETFLFDVTGNLPYSMTCSPTSAAKEYVAYMSQLTGTSFGGIVIRRISTGEGLAKVELNFSPGIISCDWSNTGTQLVYCTTSEVHTINLDGTGDTAVVTGLTNVTYVAWKYGTKIAYVHTVGSDTILSLINANGTGNVDMPAAASVEKPQISAANNNLIYGLAGGSFCSVDVSAGTPVTTEVVANFKGQVPRLDPTGATATYDKLIIENSGLYALDLTTKAETKIK